MARACKARERESDETMDGHVEISLSLRDSQGKIPARGLAQDEVEESKTGDTVFALKWNKNANSFRVRVTRILVQGLQRILYLLINSER